MTLFLRYHLISRDTVLHGKDEDLSYQTNSDILDNVTEALADAFPGKHVYATFGNHDYYPSNQFPPHNNELYNDTLLRWNNWIMDPSQNSNFRKGMSLEHGCHCQSSLDCATLSQNFSLVRFFNPHSVGNSDPSPISRDEIAQNMVWQMNFNFVIVVVCCVCVCVCVCYPKAEFSSRKLY